MSQRLCRGRSGSESTRSTELHHRDHRHHHSLSLHGVTLPRLLVVILVTIILICSPSRVLVTCASGDNYDDDDINYEELLGRKQLNNIMSVAIKNGRSGGEFKTVESPKLLYTPSTNISCSRDLYLVNTLDPSTYRGALNRVYESGVLRVGIAPYAQVKFFAYNATNGELSGYFSDVIDILTNQMGFLLGRNIRSQIVPYNYTSFFTDSVNFLRTSGKVDTVIGLNYVPQRLNKVDFTCPFSDSYQFAIFKNVNDTLPYGLDHATSITAFNRPDITVPVIKDTIYDEAAAKYLPLARRIYYATDNDRLASVGSATTVVLIDLDNVTLYNREYGRRLVMVHNTEIVFSSGSAFITIN